MSEPAAKPTNARSETPTVAIPPGGMPRVRFDRNELVGALPPTLVAIVFFWLMH